MNITIQNFTEEFPYGFVDEIERTYVERVEKFLKKFPETQHSLIFDLLDLQWVALVQQLLFIGDETGSSDQGRIHFVFSRLQINANLRAEHGLPSRNMRSALHRFKYQDVLQILENAEWEPDKGKEQGSFKNGIKDGPWVQYYETDQLFWTGDYKDGKREGPWVYYWFNGKLKEKANYKNGERDGPWVVHYENGRLDAKGDYKDGKLEGPWIGYYENGELSWKSDYKDGKREGSWVWYWENGQLKEKGDCKNGTEEGPWVRYYEDGQLQEKGYYKNGKKDGSWLFHDEKVQLYEKRSETYKNGKEVK